MFKKILSFLFVGMIGYSLGTMSTLHADDAAAKNPDIALKKITELEKKVDQVLKNQDELKKLVKKIWLRS